MKKIPLTQGKFAIVDDEDYDFLNQWKWQYSCGGYAIRTDRVQGKRTILMHRVILERMGFTDFEECDHINQHRCDNSRPNLRPATRGQNRRNKSKQSSNISGYIGVGWCRDKLKWRARITVNGKQKHLGLFKNIEDAVQARDKAAKKYHGEFAALNKEK